MEQKHFTTPLTVAASALIQWIAPKPQPRQLETKVWMPLSQATDIMVYHAQWSEHHETREGDIMAYKEHGNNVYLLMRVTSGGSIKEKWVSALDIRLVAQ